MQTDIHQVGTKGSKSAFGLIHCRNFNIAESLGEEGDTEHAEVFAFSTKMLGKTDRINANTGSGANQILGTVETELRFLDER